MNTHMEMVDLCDSDTDVPISLNETEDDTKCPDKPQFDEIIQMRKRNGQKEYLVKMTNDMRQWIPKVDIERDHIQKIISFYENAIQWS